MNISRDVLIPKSNFVTQLYREDIFPSYLDLELSFSGERFLENFEWGYIDLQYILFADFPETKRIILTYQDFLEESFVYKINAGEFLNKITVGGYFVNMADENYTLKINLKSRSEQYTNKTITLTHIHESINIGPTINFLEQCRALTKVKREQIISTELDNLEARIDEASGRAFNFLVLDDFVSSIKDSQNALLIDKYGFQKQKMKENSKIRIYPSDLEIETRSSSNIIAQNLEFIGKLHENYIKENKTHLESKFPDLIMDFDHWLSNEDSSGAAHLWIETQQPVKYHPVINSPIKEIELYRLQLVISTKIIKKASDEVCFKITGYFNPDHWEGRNSQYINQPGKTICSGFSKIIKEQDSLNSKYFLKYLEQNYDVFIKKCIHSFFRAKDLHSEPM